MITTPPLIPVSVGELADKITILMIKSERISDPEKKAAVLREAALLQPIWDEILAADARLAEPFMELRTTNEELWEIEDQIRDCESRGDFGADFVRLARAVYMVNDRRGAAKRRIDALSGSPVREMKSYTPY
jgi:hypothetical protein